MSRSTESEFARTGERVAGKVEDLVDTASAKARQAQEAVEEKLGETAEGLRDTIKKTSHEAAEVVSKVTDQVRSSADYLEEQGFSGVMDDLGTLIKRYPLHAVIIGAGIGFLLARGRSH